VWGIEPEARRCIAIRDLGWDFIQRPGRLEFLQFLNNLEDAVPRSTDSSSTNLSRGVFEDHAPGDHALDADRFFSSTPCFFLLGLAAEDANEDGGVFKLAAT